MQMPKATIEGGATNAWEPPPPLLCSECGAQVAPGAPRCPECPSTSFEAVLQEHPGTGEEMHGIEAPADGTPVEIGNDPVPGEPEPVQVTQLPESEAEATAEPQAPDAALEPAPAAPPRTPPRRAG